MDRIERYRVRKQNEGTLKRLVVDPTGCGCLDCVTGSSVPADLLTEEQKDRVADDDNVVDRTGYTEREWERFF